MRVDPQGRSGALNSTTQQHIMEVWGGREWGGKVGRKEVGKGGASVRATILHILYSLRGSLSRECLIEGEEEGERGAMMFDGDIR